MFVLSCIHSRSLLLHLTEAGFPHLIIVDHALALSYDLFFNDQSGSERIYIHRFDLRLLLNDGVSDTDVERRYILANSRAADDDDCLFGQINGVCE